MVDITKATESPYLTVDFIKKSTTKKAVIIDGGNYEDGDFGKKLTMRVSMDKKEKIWNPNRESANNMMMAWGKETNDYIEKIIILSLKEENKKTLIIATPEVNTIKDETVVDEKKVD